MAPSRRHARGPDSAPDLARIFRALSVDTRVRIVQPLQAQSLCVNALAVRLAVTHSAVSHHLWILREAGPVVPDRRGTWVHYRLNQETMREWAEAAAGVLGRGSR